MDAIGLVRALRSKGAAVRRALSGLAAQRVGNSAELKEVRSFADWYFRDSRSGLVAGGVPEELLASIDQTMQHLVRLAQRRSTRSAYFNAMRSLGKDLDSLELSILPIVAATRDCADQAFDARDRKILATLDEISPSAAGSYRQGLRELQGPDRTSWRGTATEFRETLREVLDRLAPDKDVMAQDGFKPEAGRDRPTRKQKTAFILRKRVRSTTAARPAEETTGIVEELVSRFVPSVYSEAARGTHSEPTRDDVSKIKGYVEAVLGDLLEVGT